MFLPTGMILFLCAKLSRGKSIAIYLEVYQFSTGNASARVSKPLAKEATNGWGFCRRTESKAIASVLPTVPSL
jgi:hypothetical protein